jgi:hypothetical protein
MISKVNQARAFIADAERIESSQLTRIDAAINAAALLDPAALFDAEAERYLHIKYARTLTDDELALYYFKAVNMAHHLLLNLEVKDDDRG